MKTPEFVKKRRSNMTLEKLLIFGFALAALMAVTTLGSNMWGARETAESDFQKAIDNF